MRVPGVDSCHKFTSKSGWNELHVISTGLYGIIEVSDGITCEVVGRLVGVVVVVVVFTLSEESE